MCIHVYRPTALLTPIVVYDCCITQGDERFDPVGGRVEGASESKSRTGMHNSY